jgi:hypothetical protein
VCERCLFVSSRAKWETNGESPQHRQNVDGGGAMTHPSLVLDKGMKHFVSS